MMGVQEVKLSLGGGKKNPHHYTGCGIVCKAKTKGKKKAFRISEIEGKNQNEKGRGERRKKVPAHTRRKTDGDWTLVKRGGKQGKKQG